MSDIKSEEQRSINMSHIRSKNTVPEVTFRKWLFSRGYRYGLNNSKIPGHPDLWMPKYNTAVFIHGCFWHRHMGCKYAYMPKSRVDYWGQKFSRNVTRDLQVKKMLLEKHVRILIVWECTIKEMSKSIEKREEIFESVHRFFHSNSDYLEL